MPSCFDSYAAARDWMFGLKNRGPKFGVERMCTFAERLGSPQKDFPCIHVAGTNGKGSVSAMLESIYRTTGLRTGLYTSPHLVHQGERIQVNRIPLREEQIVRYSNELLPVALDMAALDPDDQPSFFEWMTAMAFLHFQRENVDLAILETGLGGRLDSTNVVLPEISIITSIGLDHTDFLGETLEEIAAEKAGIIKPGRPVVIGKVPPQAREVIEEIAKHRGAATHSVEDAFANCELPPTNLAGSVQSWNAATARLACRVLADKFPVADGLADTALQDVSWVGRWSKHRAGGRTVILDGAHNADALASLCENLSALERSPYVVAGFTDSEHRANSIMPVLEAHAKKLFVVQPSHPRGLPPHRISTQANTAEVPTLFPRQSTCLLGPEDATILVTGSLYLVAEVYERLHYGSSQGQQLLQD